MSIVLQVITHLCVKSDRPTGHAWKAMGKLCLMQCFAQLLHELCTGTLVAIIAVCTVMTNFAGTPSKHTTWGLNKFALHAPPMPSPEWWSARSAPPCSGFASIVIYTYVCKCGHLKGKLLLANSGFGYRIGQVGNSWGAVKLIKLLVVLKISVATKLCESIINLCLAAVPSADVPMIFEILDPARHVSITYSYGRHAVCIPMILWREETERERERECVCASFMPNWIQSIT